jgi:O-antigen ligase
MTVAEVSVNQPSHVGRHGAWIYVLGAVFVLLGVMVFPAPLVVAGRSTDLWENFIVKHVPVPYTLALLSSLLGWRRIRFTPSMRRYVSTAALLTFWVFVSSVASWNGFSLYRTRNFAIWMLIVIPGLARLLADERLRRFLVAGLAGTTTVLSFAAFTRIVRGLSVFDGNAPNFLLGENRNQVNVLVVFVIPLLLGKAGPRWLVRIRWPLIGLAVTWVLFSGGRAGLVALGVVGLTYALVQSTGSRRLRAVFAGLVMALIAIYAAQAVGGQAVESETRLAAALNGDLTPGTETRQLLAKKAWHLAVQNPAFGVGYGLFPFRVEPGLESQVTPKQSLGLRQFAHDTYAQMLAECGFPGLILFIAILVMVLLATSAAETTAARGAVAAFVGLLLVMGFESLLIGPLFTIPLALVFGIAYENELSATAVHPEPALDAA